MEIKYFVPPKGYEFLHIHIPPGSLVVSVANEQEQQSQQGPTPKAKDAKKLDLFGRKVYSTGGLHLRIANQQALLSQYDFNSWSAIAKFKELLPQESGEFLALALEGKSVARKSLQAALDVADSAARSMASAVIVRRSSWPQSLGLPSEVQQTVQDLPFEGKLIFSEQTDLKLPSLKDSRATLKSLELRTPAPARKHSKP